MNNLLWMGMILISPGVAYGGVQCARWAWQHPKLFATRAKDLAEMAAAGAGAFGIMFLVAGGMYALDEHNCSREPDPQACLDKRW